MFSTITLKNDVDVVERLVINKIINKNFLSKNIF